MQLVEFVSWVRVAKRKYKNDNEVVLSRWFTSENPRCATVLGGKTSRHPPSSFLLAVCVFSYLLVCWLLLLCLYNVVFRGWNLTVWGGGGGGVMYEPVGCEGTLRGSRVV